MLLLLLFLTIVVEIVVDSGPDVEISSVFFVTASIDISM